MACFLKVWLFHLVRCFIGADMDVDMEVDMDTEDSNMPEVPDVLPSVEFQPSIVATTPHYAYPLPHKISYLPPAISLPPCS